MIKNVWFVLLQELNRKYFPFPDSFYESKHIFCNKSKTQDIRKFSTNIFKSLERAGVKFFHQGFGESRLRFYAND